MPPLIHSADDRFPYGVWALRISRELVTLKDLHDEVSRRKQRRAYWLKRDPGLVRETDAMEADYKARKVIAWSNARVVLLQHGHT